MARDCEELSPSARAIFEKIRAYILPDPWDRPTWTEEGKIYCNGWYDLRKSGDRSRLEERKKGALGYAVEIFASSYRNKNGSLDGFTSQHFSPTMQRDAEFLLLLSDLDFQIETGDLVGL